MRFEQLEYIAAVTQFGSLRRASERLHISQPALSEAVRNLEKELGVTLLDRRRSGSRISRQGRDLLQNMAEVLEAVNRLRVAAGDQTTTSRMVRVGTVNAATSTLLVPAVREFRMAHPQTTVEVVNTQQAEIYQGLSEGALDLGLINVLDGDDLPPSFEATHLVHGRPVIICRADHRLANQPSLTLEEVHDEPWIMMRSGYLMHRFVHRLFGTDMPAATFSTDGAEMGKLMVAEGLGITALPDYSVVGDPLHRAGIITHRPLADDSTGVGLVSVQRRGEHLPSAVRDLQKLLTARATAYDSVGTSHREESPRRAVTS